MIYIEPRPISKSSGLDYDIFIPTIIADKLIIPEKGLSEKIQPGQPEDLVTTSNYCNNDTSIKTMMDSESK